MSIGNGHQGPDSGHRFDPFFSLDYLSNTCWNHLLSIIEQHNKWSICIIRLLPHLKWRTFDRLWPSSKILVDITQLSVCSWPWDFWLVNRCKLNCCLDLYGIIYYRNRFSSMISARPYLLRYNHIEPDKTDLVLTSNDFPIDFWKYFMDFASNNQTNWQFFW